MARSRKKLGEILVAMGAATQAQVDEVMKSKPAGKRIGEALVEAGAAKDEDVAKAVAKQFGLSYGDLSDQAVVSQIDPPALPVFWELAFAPSAAIVPSMREWPSASMRTAPPPTLAEPAPLPRLVGLTIEP